MQAILVWLCDLRKVLHKKLGSDALEGHALAGHKDREA